MLYTPGRSGIAVEAEQVGLGIKLDLAYPKMADPPDVCRCRLLRAWLLRAGRGELRLLRRHALPGSAGRRPRCWPAWSRRPRPTTRSPISRRRGPGSRTCCGFTVATGHLSQAQAAGFYRQPLDLVGGPPGACTAPQPLERITTVPGSCLPRRAVVPYLSQPFRLDRPAYAHPGSAAAAVPVRVQEVRARGRPVLAGRVAVPVLARRVLPGGRVGGHRGLGAAGGW